MNSKKKSDFVWIQNFPHPKPAKAKVFTLTAKRFPRKKELFSNTLK